MSISAFEAWLAEPSGFASDLGATGGVVAVVDLTGAPGEAPPEVLRRAARTVPGVIVGLAPGDPGPGIAPWAELIDVVLARSDDDGAAGVAVGAGTGFDAEMEGLLSATDARPRAAAALALLLRGGEERSIGDGLVAESAAYSMLQAGPEFAAWRAGRRAPRAGSGADRDAVPVQVGRDGDRLTLTLSRPAVHNAVNTAMRDALAEAFAVGIVEPAVTVVLQGAGCSFCSGGDLGEFGTSPDPATAHLIRLARSPAALAARLSPRLVARVHGACIGAGVELAAFAGRVVAEPGTFFALPEVALGLIPGSGGTVSLPRRIGRHRTAWLALTGERIGVERARRWGLVDEIA